MKGRSLRSAVDFYLSSRRQLGFALQEQDCLLDNLVDYAQERGHRGPLTSQLALDWAQLPPPPPSRQRARRLLAIRQFALFWASFDPRTQIPPAGLFGSAYGPRRSVHIYSAQEMTQLMTAAHRPDPANPCPDTFGALLGLLACTGLRISEALGLELQDWEPSQAVLTVRQSKFGQSRYVPLSAGAADVFGNYLQHRFQAFPRAKDRGLFLNQCGHPLREWQVRATFTALRQQLGWQERRPRPRLHDLRHTFAVNCLLRWYRQGQEELNAKILCLATYLGHRNIRHTYWYLSAVPELLALGSARWAKALASQKGAIHA
jgi:integrase/recombinase XerD